MSLEEMLEAAEDQARCEMVGTDDALVPTFVILNNRNQALVLRAPWKSDEQKEASLFIAASYINSEICIAYSFVSEAWIIERKEMTSERPSQAIDRFEAVTAIAVDRDRIVGRSWRTIRDESGTCVSLEKLEGHILSGRIASLFDKPTVQ